ncbi:MAG: 1-acyl-sn-glycerol-3-phosphate acyltransferase [Gammaproteobacteria bacterium]|nr:1-acyl-sn-glycerol-3-phosphate acyltransferase [Gammaproteobacteria bacterium]
MLAKMGNLIRGSIIIILLLINTIIASVRIYLGTAVLYILPVKSWRRTLQHFVQNTSQPWTTANNWILKLCLYKKWDVSGVGELKPNSSYLMIANHCSGIDILALYGKFNYQIPTIKFFVKRELLWSLPFAGVAIYLLGFPFLVRHTRDDIRKNPSLKGKDIETAKIACRKFKKFPCTVMNFLEGTRFSKAKHLKQKSPYKNLLKPKSAGAAVVINEMSETLEGIIDVTLQYSPEHLNFWEITCGRLQKIKLRYRVLPITDDLKGDFYNDREYRRRFNGWIDQLWQAKDRQLEDLKKIS